MSEVIFTAEQLEEALLKTADNSWYELQEALNPGAKLEVLLRGQEVKVKVVEVDTSFDDPDSYGESFGRDHKYIFKAKGRFFLKPARYESFNGTVWGDFREVTPIQRVVTTFV